MARFGIPRHPMRVNDNSQHINLRRGLFRVWLLLSVAWLLGWGVYLTMFGIRVGFKSIGEILEIPVLLIGPPVALLLFGLMTGWAFKGFVVNSGKSH
jgi:hypothetical protein